MQGHVWVLLQVCMYVCTRTCIVGVVQLCGHPLVGQEQAARLQDLEDLAVHVLQLVGCRHTANTTTPLVSHNLYYVTFRWAEPQRSTVVQRGAGGGTTEWLPGRHAGWLQPVLQVQLHTT